ncbi:MAG TPA: L-histidine N(alpha)-methyltransferase [Allosphingosinicella sp.]|jgi:dimethylhistidine N-methyltransferase|uniref:L-histidine N(alpha)-methyltransferase n=1 Tax=Allosphingosinicella sp. TaxID=2823234 RepID=UPI002F27E2C3
MHAPRQSADPAFRGDVLAGLKAPIPAIPARWLYDRRGSELFEEITRLPEYYPTRTERALLEEHSADVARIAGIGDAVIEFGSGSSTKTPLLLRAVAPSAYVPIDISGDFLRDSAAGLQAEFPDLSIHPVEADFMRPIRLPAAVEGLTKLGFFPGSTIGNLVPRTATDLLRAMKDTLGEGSWLLIGMDRTKPVDVLLAAYDDAAGVTAAFNLNLLHRINAELEAEVPVDAFRHRAIWNDRMSRMEMHLEAVRDVAFRIEGESFTFRAGQTIHTENSHKYGLRDSRLLLRAAGWAVCKEWTDPDDWFALILAEAEPPRFAP